MYCRSLTGNISLALARPVSRSLSLSLTGLSKCAAAVMSLAQIYSRSREQHFLQYNNETGTLTWTVFTANIWPRLMTVPGASRRPLRTVLKRMTFLGGEGNS